ncbi:MAG: hypothetical protein QW756_00450 [Nitrososphaerota archaeon]
MTGWLETISTFLLAGTGVAFFGYLLVRDAELLSDKLGLGRFLIGFLLLSVVTSLPEMTVAALSSAAGVVDISVGDILGSNIVNIALVVSLSTIFITRLIAVQTKLLKDLAGILYFSSAIPIILVFIPQASVEIGIILILSFLIYIYLTFKESAEVQSQKMDVKTGYPLILLMALAGASGTIYSATHLVEAAKRVVELAGISELEVGAKFVALSTSAPELATVLTSAKRHEYEMALGNAVGSNLTNVTLILGALLTISGSIITFQQHISTVLFVLLVTLTFWFFVSRGRLTKMAGLILLALYSAFLIYGR